MNRSAAPVWRLADRREESRTFSPIGAEEAARVERLRDAETAQDFLHARFLLRQLAGEMLGCSPASVSLEGHDDAPPRLVDAPAMGVSWSRSGPLALAALYPGGRVGADLERVRPIRFEPMLDMIAQASERAAVLEGADEADARLAFYRLWCAKEAVLKWQGTGLRGGAKTVTIPESFIRGETDRMQIEQAGIPLTLHLLQTPPDRVAALAFSR
ncbi:4'-phosphopantetheinyl transferase family protein [Henriciella aquimarina]|uniref:4'-phosphopantetheinyl transferase family protein n=1 Tax=Henriciella aquimarina TaxID=545261 RepID=UPI000A063B56|nr:4'-phosphopantetheinyl transferase superfamily protein [Henriciella aquimarina]